MPDENCHLHALSVDVAARNMALMVIKRLSMVPVLILHGASSLISIFVSQVKLVVNRKKNLRYSKCNGSLLLSDMHLAGREGVVMTLFDFMTSSFSLQRLSTPSGQCTESWVHLKFIFI